MLRGSHLRWYIGNDIARKWNSSEYNFCAKRITRKEWQTLIRGRTLTYMYACPYNQRTIDKAKTWTTLA